MVWKQALANINKLVLGYGSGAGAEGKKMGGDYDNSEGGVSTSQTVLEGETGGATRLPRNWEVRQSGPQM